MRGHPVRFALLLNIYGQRQDTPFERFRRVAQLAEEVGFDGLYLPDHMFLAEDRYYALSADPARPYFLEAWTTLSAVAAVTSRIRVGPQVTPLTLRHPAFIARMGATLDVVSGGRLLLQVGSGWNEREYRAFGLPFEPRFRRRMEMLAEGVEVIRKLWTEDGWVSFQGKHYHLDRAPLWPKPLQKPCPPIWFGGKGRLSQELAGHLGDGWTPAAPHYRGLDPEEYRQGIERARAAARAAGRDAEALVPGALFWTSIDEDRGRALRAAEILRRRRDWATWPAEELVRLGIVLAGNPDDCIAGLERYVRAGVRYFTLSFIPQDIEKTEAGLRLYQRYVLPHFAAG